MAWVAKLDYKLDSAGKHNLSVRGTLADNTQDQTLAEFPGQAPASSGPVFVGIARSKA